jgi:hypothetical protein
MSEQPAYSTSSTRYDCNCWVRLLPQDDRTADHDEDCPEHPGFDGCE